MSEGGGGGRASEGGGEGRASEGGGGRASGGGESGSENSGGVAASGAVGAPVAGGEASGAGAALAGRRLYSVVDHAATALFAVEGATAGILAGLDLLGVLVVGFCTALAGGILRDVLLGDLPPAAFRSPSRIVVALGAAAFTCLIAGELDIVPATLIAVFDAAGLALFAVTGAQKALDHHSNGLVVVILGALTATGGGGAARRAAEPGAAGAERRHLRYGCGRRCPRGVHRHAGEVRAGVGDDRRIRGVFRAADRRPHVRMAATVVSVAAIRSFRALRVMRSVRRRGPGSG